MEGVDGAPTEVEQLLLLADRPRRDLEAADRALARLRAQHGDDAVVRARLTDGHLPEARFTFERLDHLVPPKNHRPARGEGPPPGFRDPSPRRGLASSVVEKTDPHPPTGTPGGEDGSPGLGEVRRKHAGVPPPGQDEEQAVEKRRTLVRRIYARPIPLQPRPVCGPRGAHLAGMDREPFTDLNGPYVVSGGWWAREVEREYHFATGAAGTLKWVYFDRRRRRWFVHGEVE